MCSGYLLRYFNWSSPTMNEQKNTELSSYMLFHMCTMLSIAYHRPRAIWAPVTSNSLILFLSVALTHMPQPYSIMLLVRVAEHTTQIQYAKRETLSVLRTSWISCTRSLSIRARWGLNTFLCMPCVLLCSARFIEQVVFVNGARALLDTLALIFFFFKFFVQISFHIVFLFWTIRCVSFSRFIFRLLLVFVLKIFRFLLKFAIVGVFFVYFHFEIKLIARVFSFCLGQSINRWILKWLNAKQTFDYQTKIQISFSTINKNKKQKKQTLKRKKVRWQWCYSLKFIHWIIIKPIITRHFFCYFHKKREEKIYWKKIDSNKKKTVKLKERREKKLSDIIK